MSNHHIKHTWEGEGSRAGHSQLSRLVILRRVWFPWVFSLLLKVQVRVYTERATLQRVLGYMQELAGLWAPALLSPLLQENQTADSKARPSILPKMVVSLTFSSFSTCKFAFELSVCATRHAEIKWVLSGNYHSNRDTLNTAPQQIKGCFFFWRENIKWRIWKLPIQCCHRDASQIILLAKTKQCLLLTAKDHVLILAVAVNSFPMELHLPWEGF